MLIITRHSEPKYLLFLGAGAACPFGFKLATEFVDHFLGSESFSPSDLGVVDRLKRSITRNDFRVDSEAFMECLQGGARPFPFLKAAGPFLASAARTQPISKLRGRTVVREAKERLRRRFEECLISHYYKEDSIIERQARLVYDRLLSKVSGLSDWKNAIPEFKKSVFEVFTTNYDNSLDVYAQQTGETFTRGLRVSNKIVTFVLDEFGQDFVRLRITKLHGSVELSRLANGEITSEVPPPHPGQYVNGHKVVAKVMAYGLSKEMYSEPYLDFLKRLRDQLASVSECTVVGYSFRDAWIRRIFEDAVSRRKPSEFRIKIVSRSARRIKRSWHDVSGFIDPIPQTIEEYLELPVRR